MSYPSVTPSPAHPGHSGHSGYSAPTEEESSRRSIWSTIGSATGKAFAMPLRIASTAVNGGIFAAYYVTAAALTGLAATGGTIYGMGKIATDIVRGKPHKSLGEYAIAPARKTFNFISRLYYELPKHGAEVIFAGVAIAAVVTLAIVASSQGGGGGGGGGSCFIWLDTSSHHYHGSGSGGDGDTGSREGRDDDYNPSGISAALYPYRPAIVIGRKIMGKTTELLNRGQEVD